MNRNTLGWIFIHIVTLSHLVKKKNRKYECLDGHFKERTNQRSHMLGTQIPSIQGFCASYFLLPHMALKFGEATWKVFEKGMKMHMMSHVKVCSLTTYHILLTEFGEFPI
jgi:hypothetical protein